MDPVGSDAVAVRSVVLTGIVDPILNTLVPSARMGASSGLAMTQAGVTVTANDPVARLPATSVALHDTVVVPMANTEPTAGVQAIDAGDRDGRGSVRRLDDRVRLRRRGGEATAVGVGTRHPDDAVRGRPPCKRPDRRPSTPAS
jgi:hypothetical protein